MALRVFDESTATADIQLLAPPAHACMHVLLHLTQCMDFPLLLWDAVSVDPAMQTC